MTAQTSANVVSIIFFVAFASKFKPVIIFENRLSVILLILILVSQLYDHLYIDHPVFIIKIKIKRRRKETKVKTRFYKISHKTV